MSRLDDHVGLVRVKLTFATFVRLVPWAFAILAGVAFGAILVERIVPCNIPRPRVWIWIGVAAGFVVPLVYAIVRRPTARQAAVAIDERLGLMEKFSTALYVRRSSDPFAAAAVKDAELAASSANLHNKFPIAFPARGAITLLFAVAVAVVSFWLPPRVPANALASAGIDLPKIDRTDPRIRVQQALAEIDGAPREVRETEQIREAKKDLSEILKKPITDGPAARERAEDALNRIEAIKKKIDAAQRYVTSVNEMNILKNVGDPSPSDDGPVADAQRALGNQNLEQAVENLKTAVDNFPKMSEAEKEKAARQMKNLADQVTKQANDPKVQQQMKDELQKAGVDKKQADEITKKMQEAANGVPDAAKQAQQMVNQAIQNANQNKQKPGQNMSPQQQQALANQIQQAAKKAQQQANAQANAQQMAQTTQGLAKAMQQAANQGKGQQANQNAGAKGQQQANANGQQGAQQGGQQQSAQGQSQKGGAGQGSQGSGQNGGAGQSAQQQMQQQLGQLQAMAKDAQGTNAGQQMAQGGNQQPGQQGGGQGQIAGQQGNGQQNGPNGQNGPGQQQAGPGAQNGPLGAGGIRPAPEVAQFQTVQELSKSQTIESGQIIASSFVKAPSERGQSKLKLTDVIESKTKGEDGEVTTLRIPRGAQKAVKDYFDTLKQDEPAK